MNAKTGAVQWRAAWPPSFAGVGYSTPVHRRLQDSDEVLLVGGGRLIAYDVKTGDKQWEMDSLPMVAAATPTLDGNHLYLNCVGLPGDVDVQFSNDVGARFDIETFNGDIENCFGPKAERTSKYTPGLELSFTEGALLKIAQEVVRIQTGFLDHGISQLTPLKMVDVAEHVGVHVSTISRALASWCGSWSLSAPPAASVRCGCTATS